MDTVTLQDLFEGQASFTPKNVGIILDFQELWEKHKPSSDQDEWPVSYYNDLSDIAAKYNVSYKSPTHLGVLKSVTEVGSSAVLH